MMKKLFSSLLFAAIFGMSAASAQFARVQIIHNSPDLAADSVDIYVNGSLALNNFGFRQATPFIDLPAGVALDIAVAPKTSTSVANALATFPFTLSNGSTYIVVASGLVSPSGYMPNQPFTLEAFPVGREIASTPGNTDVLVMHGSTDAPTVDIWESSVGSIIDDIAYPTFSSDYLELATADYTLEVRDQTGTTIVATYGAPLQTLNLQDSALVVLASGFLNQAQNSNGPAFGLYAALATGGTLIPLPPAGGPSTARVQIIHNCADLNANVVDVWLNDVLALDNFAFRESTPFIDLAAGNDLDISIQPSNSTDTVNALARFTVNLTPNEKYVVVASGIVVPAGYNPAPAFNLEIYPMAREMANIPTNTDVLVMHGSTDAPTVDVVAVGAGTLIDNVSYPQFSNYLELATADYNVQIRNAAGTDVVAEYIAPLSTLNLSGQSLVVLASGFLDPTNNNNGAAFGLYAAPAAGGTLIPLPTANISTARVQVIHNCPDLAADTVDVWLNDALLLDNFVFRTASPFIDAAAGQSFDVSIQPSNSIDTTNALARFTYTLAGNGKYILIANGIVSPSGYTPAQPFNIDVFADGREVATDGANTDVLIYHGSTDAPMVDVVGPVTLANDLSYSEFNAPGYLELPTADYVVNIFVSSTNTFVIGYDAPLATLNLNGAALTVLASGFLDPSQNSNGEAFGLWVALPSGGALIPLPISTGIKANENNSTLNAYPNPASDMVTIVSSNELKSNTVVTITDIGGRIVMTQTVNANNGLSKINLNVSNLEAGLYFANLSSENSSQKVSFSVVR
jgi:hypothetical protein